MADTAIEWADRVWNPNTGCDRVSPGCDHCYAMTMAKRLKGMGQAKYQRDGDPRTSGPGFGVSVHPDALDLPLKWRKPQRIFVNSMSDLFHDEVPSEYIAKVFAVMAFAERHTFQVLTKRHARMRSLLNADYFRTAVLENLAGLSEDRAARFAAPHWPLPNVWLGVSAENQQWADIRIPPLLDTPAAVRFVSAEPMLGPIDLHTDPIEAGSPFWGSQLDWCITGGESGPGARPAHPDWFRSIRDQCQSAGVAYLHKQHGEYVEALDPRPSDRWLTGEGTTHDEPWHPGQVGAPAGKWSPYRDVVMRRVGKHRAGRELDGRTWDGYPKAVTHA
ncbi:hypothetical protein A9W98_17955 [Mycobacterium gordonae]|uniref:Phage Gp37/Gp68 family protein n=1 Tax=Mycobacterium gordonae TaxID=1778 RepID=A0A1A6BHR4_MYCGO|nr:phage Gp37/Gp68 family protein [Mycobacterium gordonae]OBS01868.1 hypothetical protein A9W98_17955 [Mycobacterium gordonae]